MNGSVVRQYSCRDEELPVLCGFALFSFRRDQAEFEAYAPRFKKPYDDQFEKRIADLSAMVAPASETQEVKSINDSIHLQMSFLLDAVNRLGGYLDYLKPGLVLTEAGFGLKGLRYGIHTRDVEKVLSASHIVSANMVKYKVALETVGLTEEFATNFDAAGKTIGKNKQDAYAISSNRNGIVQANLAYFNELYAQLKEILKGGKILFKKKDPVKYGEYTLTHLRKGVRQVSLTAAQIAARAKASEKRSLKMANPNQ